MQPIIINKFLPFLIFLLLTCPKTAGGIVLSRYPYIQSVTESSVRIAWKTDIKSDSTIDYGTDQSFGSKISSSNITNKHTLQINNLEPGSTYYYKISGNETDLSEDEKFHTAPSGNTAVPEFSFIAIGDSGCGCPEQLAIASAIEAIKPDFAIHTGDVTYPKGEESEMDPKFFSPYKNIIKEIPFYPVIGNHDASTDNAAPYLEAFYLPGNNFNNTERYYSFDYGNSHFVAIDSVTSVFHEGTPQYQWLEEDLKKTQKKWIFAYLHHPLYSSASDHDGDPLIRDNLAPLFEKYGVDIVFQGHAHNYQRTQVMRDYHPNAKGVVYILTGSGGEGRGSLNPSSFIAYAEVTPHFLHIKINGNSLNLRALKSDGTIIDSYTITKATDLGTGGGCGGFTIPNNQNKGNRIIDLSWLLISFILVYLLNNKQFNNP